MNTAETPNGNTLCLILLTLHAEGPLNFEEIMEETGLTRGQVEKSVYNARRKYGSKVIAVHRYEARTGGIGGQPTPHFGPGRHRDAPRVLQGRRATQANYDEKNRMRKRLADRLRRGRTPISPFYGLMK